MEQKLKMLRKNDFIELDFVARVKETSQVFDTTIEEEAKKAKLFFEEDKAKYSPIKICVGQGMLLKGLDRAIEGKEAGKKFEIELLPKEAFGERNPNLIRILPIKLFRDRGIEPAPGIVLTLDNILVRVSAVSGGRVIVDFNNPLSGKTIIYTVILHKKIEDEKEKVAVLAEFFFKVKPEISIENKKAVLNFNNNIEEKFKKEFQKKVKEILDLDAVIE